MLRYSSNAPIETMEHNVLFMNTKEGDIMAVENIGLSYASASVNTKSYGTKGREGEASKAEEKKDVYGEAAVYEKSEGSSNVSAKNMSVDRDALVAQLKADSEAQVKSLMDIVNKTISGQGKAFSMASGDDMWKFLASGNFTVDAETKAQAQKDIAEDGYWGVEKTSDRIVDFAKALSGGDEKKADELIGAFKKGFEQATKAWGRDLPSISNDTLSAANKLFEDYYKSKESEASSSGMA